jgi:hypothetical protein
MHLTVRDALATVFVAAAAAVYLPWLAGAAMTGWSARAIATVVFALGFAACVTDQKQMGVVYGAGRDGPRSPVSYVVLASAMGALALVAGVIALVTGSSVMLAILAAAVAGLWLFATARHALTRAPGGHAPASAA